MQSGYCTIMVLSLIHIYHRELVPARLLFAVSAAQRGVPLPIGWEILLMLFVLEALKEAGARTPGAMGQTMSIVGGLVLGDAAVSARFAAEMCIRDSLHTQCGRTRPHAPAQHALHPAHPA